MKTSKIIFISFFSLLGLFLLSLLIEFPHKAGIPAKTQVHETSLSGVRFVTINSRYGVQLGSEGNKLNFFYIEGKKPSKLPFRISNDTLIIDSIGQSTIGELYLNLTALEKVEMQNSGLEIKTFNQSRLSIGGSSSDINLNSSYIDTMLIDLRDGCEFYTDGHRFSLLSVKLNHSNAQVYSEEIGTVTAELCDTSELAIEKAFKLDVKSDSTSRFYSR